MHRCLWISALALVAAMLGSAYAADIVYAYDALGRVIRVDYPSGQRVCYYYDPAGNISSINTITTATSCP